MRHAAVALLRRVAVLFALCALLVPTGQACGPKKFHGKDKEMLERVKIVSEAVSNYQLTNAEWPESLDVVKEHVPYGEHWPDNPYNGRPIADTGSPDFDPQTSVGMVFYQKLYRGDMLVNYQLHVFGEKGKLIILGNTKFGVKE